MPRPTLFLIFACGWIFWPADASPQEIASQSKTYIQIGHEFLRALYPELNNKGYTITIETSSTFDDPSNLPTAFRLDVGKGARYFEIGCCFRGTANPPMTNILSLLPPPAELGPPSPPPCPVCPPQWWKSPSTPPLLKNVDAEGRLHPEQFLSAKFVFERPGQLESFSAGGPIVGEGFADSRLYDELRAHPDLTRTQLAEAFHRSGAKYGWGDQDEFRKTLPIKSLAQFLGKLEVSSMEFSPLRFGDSSESSPESAVWGLCEVSLKATTQTGSVLEYRALFGHESGALSSLYHVKPSPVAPKKRPD